VTGPSTAEERPVIVQNDHTLLLETGGPRYEEARDALVPFAELVKAPEYVHTYRLTPLSLWNAASAGHTAPEVLAALEGLSRFPVPANVQDSIRTHLARYGRLRLLREEGGERRLLLLADDSLVLDEAWACEAVRALCHERVDPTTVVVKEDGRGRVKQELIAIGWPVEDVAGYREGKPLEVALRDPTQEGLPFQPRDYQRKAVEAFHKGGAASGGSGVVVLPCGAGKTIVGLAALAAVSQHTLIVCTSDMAVRQWERELLDKTTIPPYEVCELTGRRKELGPVTLTTYQLLTHRKAKTDESYPAMERVRAHPWGLVIYDEVHLLPAPVFRMACEIQAVRRLGLTATLVREDGRASDVFSLIGPKRYDVPWKVLEQKGWIAQATCVEVRVPMTDTLRREYATTPQREKFRVAASSGAKLDVLFALLERHRQEPTLVIGTYLEQLEQVAALTGAPQITGKTPAKERERLCGLFRAGRLNLLLLSSVGNYSLDLPEASVLVQVSGLFGSRQEEAQRLGRVLRPKQDGRPAAFYTLVTEGTVETEFAMNRQRFLTEQGYRYSIVDAAAVLAEGGP
jgi:DNA excision repair protein ERCC-3